MLLFEIPLHEIYLYQKRKQYQRIIQNTQRTQKVQSDLHYKIRYGHPRKNTSHLQTNLLQA